LDLIKCTVDELHVGLHIVCRWWWWWRVFCPTQRTRPITQLRPSIDTFRVKRVPTRQRPLLLFSHRGVAYRAFRKDGGANMFPTNPSARLNVERWYPFTSLDRPQRPSCSQLDSTAGRRILLMKRVASLVFSIRHYERVTVSLTAPRALSVKS
jgi:hypothetical protein